MIVRFLRVVAAVLALAAPLSACGVGDDRAKARTVTERFYAAIRDDDGEAACEELSEDVVKQLESQSGQCADAVTSLQYEDGAIERVQVFATNAKVDLAGGESAFLSPEPEGWKLSAVGCKPEEGKPRDRPLDCEVEA